MNNFTFGDESTGYYETIAGGAGAGSSWAGVSGVHTHMTNTRLATPCVAALPRTRLTLPLFPHVVYGPCFSSRYDLL